MISLYLCYTRICFSIIEFCTNNEWMLLFIDIKFCSFSLVTDPQADLLKIVFNVANIWENLIHNKTHYMSGPVSPSHTFYPSAWHTYMDQFMRNFIGHCIFKVYHIKWLHLINKTNSSWNTISSKLLLFNCLYLLYRQSTRDASVD